MINESSLSTVEIGFLLLSILYRRGKKKRKKEEEVGERERAQMGEMDFADTQTEEREKMTFFLFFFILV
jgi:hypothetical protein